MWDYYAQTVTNFRVRKPKKQRCTKVREFKLSKSKDLDTVFKKNDKKLTNKSFDREYLNTHVKNIDARRFTSALNYFSFNDSDEIEAYKKRLQRNTVHSKRTIFDTSVDSRTKEMLTDSSDNTDGFNLYDENKILKWIDNARNYYDEKLIKPIHDWLKQNSTNPYENTRNHSFKSNQNDYTDVNKPYESNRSSSAFSHKGRSIVAKRSQPQVKLVKRTMEGVSSSSFHRSHTFKPTVLQKIPKTMSQSRNNIEGLPVGNKVGPSKIHLAQSETKVSVRRYSTDKSESPNLLNRKHSMHSANEVEEPEYDKFK